MKYFGTDGIRGAYKSELICESFFKKFAHCVELYFKKYPHKDVIKICIGTDTRESGPSLKKAIISGLSEDTLVFDCGILPTPAVAENIIISGCDFGFVVTASHNQWMDNGVKIFNANGEKLSIFEENEIEKIIDSVTESIPERQHYNVIDFHERAIENFCKKYKKFLPENALFGKKIVIDSANGATCYVVEKVFRNFGANIIHIGCNPNGRNINDNCGSEHIESIMLAMKNSGAFIGFANDGDGDRVVIFDENGERVDGDVLIGLLAEDMIFYKKLPNNTVVVTQQSNFGLDRFIESLGGNVIRCDIGDRNVYQSMVKNDCWFGGENSGHLIFRGFSPVGDGISAALFAISLVANSQEKLSKMKTKVALFPQKSFNIIVGEKVPLEKIGGLKDAIDSIDNSLDDPHRIVVRYSGTEPKLRVLVEAGTQTSVDHAWTNIRDAIIESFDKSGISATKE